MSTRSARSPRALAATARKQEERRGVAAFWANLVLTVLVAGMFCLQSPISGFFLLCFVFAQIIACGLYYVLPGWRDNLDDSTRGIAEELASRQEFDDGEILLERRASRWYESLWIAVSVNLMAIWGLVYWTGGPVDSPFSILPYALIVTGQMLVRVGTVKLDGVRDLPRLLRHALSQYWTALLAALIFYASLFIVNANWPHEIGAAPDYEFGLVLTMNVLLSTVMTYVSRAGTDEEGESALFPRSASDEQ